MLCDVVHEGWGRKRWGRGGGLGGNAGFLRTACVNKVDEITEWWCGALSSRLDGSVLRAGVC